MCVCVCVCVCVCMLERERERARGKERRENVQNPLSCLWKLVFGDRKVPI